MFREPEKLGNPKPERQPKPKFRRVKPVSDKRKHELQVYAKLKKVFLEDYPVCQVCDESKSKDIHHKQGRSGQWLNKMHLWLAVCRTCHRKITDNSLWAFENGYSEYRNR